MFMVRSNDGFWRLLRVASALGVAAYLQACSSESEPCELQGTRAQLSETIRALHDVTTDTQSVPGKETPGNKDGIHGNEHLGPGDTRASTTFDRHPFIARLAAHFAAGFGTRDEVRRLKAFVAEVQEEHGPVMDDDLMCDLRDGPLFAAQKAIALRRLGRTPGEVDDVLIDVSGSVGDKRVESRKVFLQHFRPSGAPSGSMVVIGPGYGMTGRDFYAQAQMLSSLGHDLLILDHQWAGKSEGDPGGIEDGESVALTTAAALAHAERIREREYSDLNGKTVLLGISMGGGPGAYGALAMIDADRLTVDGAELPKGVDAVVDGAYFGSADGLINTTLEALSYVPLVNSIRAPWLGIPDVADDPVSEAMMAQVTTMEDVRAQLSAFNRAEPFLSELRRMRDRGEVPSGHIIFVHGESDTLASADEAKAFAKAMGTRGEYLGYESSEHVRANHREERHYSVAAVRKLLGG